MPGFFHQPRWKLRCYGSMICTSISSHKRACQFKRCKTTLFFSVSFAFFPLRFRFPGVFSVIPVKSQEEASQDFMFHFLAVKRVTSRTHGGPYKRLEARVFGQDMSELDCVGATREFHLPHQISLICDFESNNLAILRLSLWMISCCEMTQVKFQVAGIPTHWKVWTCPFFVFNFLVHVMQWPPNTLFFRCFCVNFVSQDLSLDTTGQVFYLVFVLLPKFALWLVRSPGRLLWLLWHWLKSQCLSLEGLLLEQNFATVVEIDMVNAW